MIQIIDQNFSGHRATKPQPEASNPSQGMERGLAEVGNRKYKAKLKGLFYLLIITFMQMHKVHAGYVDNYYATDHALQYGELAKQSIDVLENLPIETAYDVHEFYNDEQYQEVGWGGPDDQN